MMRPMYGENSSHSLQILGGAVHKLTSIQSDIPNCGDRALLGQKKRTEVEFLGQYLCRIVSLLGVALIFPGCGGGDGKDAVCADFTYQQDAQAAYSAGAKQLDGDKDGLACEALPNRPSSGMAAQPVGTFPPYNFLTGAGVLVKLRPSLGAYAVTAYHTPSGAGSFDSGPRLPESVGGGLQVPVTFVQSMRYFRVSEATLVTWSPSYSGYSSTTGVGVESTGTELFSDIVGAYKLLGQRCSSTSKLCNVAFGTASISANGTLTMCAASTGYAGDCYSSTVSPSDPLAQNTGGEWTLGAWGGKLIASKARGTVAFTYRDNRLDAQGQPYSTDSFTFFGQLDSVTAGSVVGSTTMVSFDTAGQLKIGVPAESQWRVTAGLPIAGLFQDESGNVYLHSTTGQLISWTVGSGLRHYSRP